MRTWIVVFAVMLLVATGCASKSPMNEQASPRSSNAGTSAHKHDERTTSTLTQASSISTSTGSKSSMKAKQLPGDLLNPSELLGGQGTLFNNPGTGPNEGTSTGTGAGTNTGTGANTGISDGTGTVGTGAGTGVGTGTGAGAGNQSAGDASSFAEQVLQLVNKERQAAGLQPLGMNGDLSKVAMIKAQDMANNNYFDHQSPTYGSPFDLMKANGISYSYAGENIAQGQASPDEVMRQWMNSPGHRANILHTSFTQIGIAYYNSRWVQEFTG